MKGAAPLSMGRKGETYRRLKSDGYERNKIVIKTGNSRGLQEERLRQTAFSLERALYPVTWLKKTRQRRMVNFSVSSCN